MNALDNDGRFPDEAPVLTPYPLTAYQAISAHRASWPWLPGTILEQCGLDEWLVVMDGHAGLAFPDPDAPGEWLYPTCFRDSSELREVTVAEWEQMRVRKEVTA